MTLSTCTVSTWPNVRSNEGLAKDKTPRKKYLQKGHKLSPSQCIIHWDSSTFWARQLGPCLYYIPQWDLHFGVRPPRSAVDSIKLHTYHCTWVPLGRLLHRIWGGSIPWCSKAASQKSPLFPPNTLILLSRYFYTAGGCCFLIIDPWEDLIRKAWG